MERENLTTSLLHWGVYFYIRRPWSSNLRTFLYLLCISDKRNHRWLFLLLVLYCLLSSFQFRKSVMSDSLWNPWAIGYQASLSIPNSQGLLKLMSIESVMPSNHLILCHLLLLLPSIFPSIRGFFSESVLHIRWPKFATSASASVLPMNIQGWFPLGLTGLIPLQSNGFSRVFSNTRVQKHQFFSAQLSLWSKSHIHTWLLEKP